jgi:hypothetical protein
MFLAWDVPEPREVAQDTFGILARLLEFTRAMECDDRYRDVYVEALAVWNALFVRYGRWLDETRIADEVVDALLVGIGSEGAPVLAILFVMSNVVAWPRQADRLLSRGVVVDAMFAGFDGLGYPEKENFVIFICNLIVRQPVAVVETFSALREFIQMAIDVAGAAKSAACTLGVLRGLAAIAFAEPKTHAWIGAFADELEEMVMTGTLEVAAAAEEVMRLANLSQ